MKTAWLAGSRPIRPLCCTRCQRSLATPGIFDRYTLGKADVITSDATTTDIMLIQLLYDGCYYSNSVAIAAAIIKESVATGAATTKDSVAL